MAYIYKLDADGHSTLVAQVDEHGVIYDLFAKGGPAPIGMIDSKGNLYRQAFTRAPGRSHQSFTGYIDADGTIYTKEDYPTKEHIGKITPDGSVYYLGLCSEDGEPLSTEDLLPVGFVRGGDIRCGGALLLLPLGPNQAAKQMRSAAGCIWAVVLGLFALMLAVIL